MIASGRVNVRRSDKTSFYVYGHPDLPVPPDQLWRCNWMVDQIYRATASRPDRTDEAPLYSSWWLKVLTRKYPEYLQSLLDGDVIQRVGGYVPEEHPYSYRLASPYQHPQLLECPDRWLIHRIVEASKNRPPVIQHIEQWSRQLRIDESAARSAVEVLRPRKSFSDPERQAEVTAQLRRAMRRCIQIIADQQDSTRLDSCHGRVYTAYAGLHRSLRRYLASPDGERLVGWDVKNCQPLFDVLLAAQYYHPDRKRRLRLLKRPLVPSTNPYLVRQLITAGAPLCVPNRMSVLPYKNRSETQIGKHIERLRSPVPSCSPGVPAWLPASCLRWLAAAETTGVYEEFQDLYGGDREATKAAWPAIHYGGKPLQHSVIGRRIQERFPDMARVIDALRYDNCLVGQDRRPFRYLACTLQLYESTVMIGMVCSRIMREHPECPLWPIHDCIMTTQPYGEYVLRVLQEEFARVGLCPQFKPLEILR